MPAPKGVRLQLSDISRTFNGSVQAVDRVSLEIPAGQFVALLGPSGCGKTSLLRIVAGLERTDAGQILVDGQPRSSAEPRATAFVFQDAHLLPWRTVLRNVEVPLELIGDNATERRDKAVSALRAVGLSDALDRYPAQLSGGMRMRVSLARALVTRPQLLLLDEPFAALDEMTRRRLDEQLVELWEQSGMTVLFVTHSLLEATLLSQRAIVFSRRPARIIADEPIDLDRTERGARRTDERFLKTLQLLEDALRRAEA